MSGAAPAARRRGGSWRGLGAPPKYRNRRATVDGISFASQREAARYQALLLLVRAGVIRDLDRQPRYRLETPVNGTAAHAVVGVYVADFRYVDVESGAVVVEDAKGFATDLYRWKKRHVEAQYGIAIVEV